MPPKKKVVKENIITAAFELVRSKGVNALNARNVAAVLGCSTQPVFYEFETMDQLKQEVLLHAGKYYLSFIEEYIVMDNYLLSFGKTFIHFVQKERNLYQLLFMSGTLNEFNILEVCEENKEHVDNIIKLYGLNRRNAEKVFIQVTLYVQGIASVLYSNGEALQIDGQILQYLEDACRGFLHVYEKEEQ